MVILLSYYCSYLAELILMLLSYFCSHVAELLLCGYVAVLLLWLRC